MSLTTKFSMARGTPRLMRSMLAAHVRNYGAVERFMWCQKSINGVPKAILNDGLEIPLIGLGTWQSSPNEVTEAVRTAIKVGYRHIDCAYVYQNENEVGVGIECQIKKGIVKREDLFITSKLWNTFHRPDLVKTGCEASLEALKLKYLDLYLMHWPLAYKEGCDLFPVGKDGKPLFSPVDYVDTWQAMERLVADGLVKSIGVSNFNRKQIDRLSAAAKIPPALNQIECHPYLNQRKLMDHCKSKNVAITAYSPLGSPGRPGADKKAANVLSDDKIKKIAEAKKKSPAQILIRYQIQRSNIVIPKSTKKENIEANFKVFDFDLSPKDMETIDSLERNGRLLGALRNDGGHKYFPFHDEF